MVAGKLQQKGWDMNLARARKNLKGKKLARRILGVGQDASARELKQAWRRQCKKHHPDMGGQPEGAQRFKLARQAYRCLRRNEGCERLLEMDGAEEARADGEEAAGNNWKYFLWWRENFF
ncbi:MAG: J domain-containing protein [Planctomycetota bacterium]